MYSTVRLESAHPPSIHEYLTLLCFILLYQSHIDYPLQSDGPCGRGAGRLIEHVFMAVLRVGGPTLSVLATNAQAQTDNTSFRR